MASLMPTGSSVRLFAVLSILLSVSIAQAQTDPTGGIVPFSTRVGGPVDSLDLATGSVLISIPIRSKPGKKPFAASLLLKSHIYEYNAGGGAKTMWEPNTGINLNAGNFATKLTYQLNNRGTCNNGTLYYYNFNVVDPTGALHPLASNFHFTSPLCGGSTPSPKSVLDGSGYTVTWTSNSPSASLIYNISGISVSSASGTTTVTDPDGVPMKSVLNNSNGTVTYTDTLNATALTVSATNGSA
jgi:hypothetical protein